MTSLKKEETIDLSTIGIDRRIADSTIGFLLLKLHKGKEDATSAGTGVLVRVGGVYGILTAAHVLQKLPDSGEVGIVRFPQPKKLQMLRLKIQYAHPLPVGSKKWSELGPDIGFLKLPLTFAGTLGSTNTYISLDNARRKLEKRKLPAKHSAYEVAGILDENTEAPVLVNSRLWSRTFECRIQNGEIRRLKKIKNLDRIKFIPNPKGLYPFPKSFGGTSGGGLWRVFIAPDSKGKPTIADVRLFDIAYFETRDTKANRVLMCHGQEAIFNRMMGRIRRKWSEAK